MEKKRKYGVLIVDDSTLMRQMVARLFEESSSFYVIGMAENGQEGVERVIELHPDLVVMDVEMPRMDGLTAVKQIMIHSPVPVMMLSSYTTESSEHTFQAIESGAVDYFHKDRLFNEYHDTKVTEDFLLRCQLAAKSRLPYIMGSFGSSKELAIKVLMEAITYCMKIENDLAIAQIKLRRTLLQQRGLVLKAKEDCGRFIHTMCEGELLGVKSAQVCGKEVWHFLPPLMAHRHEAFYREAWGDQEGKSFEMVWQGRTYLTVMRLVYDLEGTGEVISLIVDITEERSAEERMNFMTNHDYLTGLPNRRQLTNIVKQELEETGRGANGITLFSIGLDHFKSINDTIGYAIGDRLLQLIARRLIRCSRGEAPIVRISGSTFIYIMRDSRYGVIVQKAEELLMNIRQPIKLDGHELHITGSIGICRYPHDMGDVDNLAKCAEMTMNFVNEQGGNQYQFFNTELNERLLKRVQIEHHLHHALERNELTIHYQPIFHLETLRIVGMESLIRWTSPELGMVSPADFIPVAEETGLIFQIGEWVLKEACRQNRLWQDQGFPKMTIMVNLCSRQLYDSKLKRDIMRILKETGLSAECLELEITESMTMDPSKAIHTLNELKSLGIRIAMDDFGTGYSSLSYLKEFPIDKLKIDQSFVKQIHINPVNQAIVNTIIGMAQQLNLQVVAEGVENKQIVDMLKEGGCGLAQGFYFSKPLDGEHATKLLREYTSSYSEDGEKFIH